MNLKTQNINMVLEQMNTIHCHYNTHKKFKMLILVLLKTICRYLKKCWYIGELIIPKKRIIKRKDCLIDRLLRIQSQDSRWRKFDQRIRAWSIRNNHCRIQWCSWCHWWCFEFVEHTHKSIISLNLKILSQLEKDWSKNQTTLITLNLNQGSYHISIRIKFLRLRNYQINRW